MSKKNEKVIIIDGTDFDSKSFINKVFAIGINVKADSILCLDSNQKAFDMLNNTFINPKLLGSLNDCKILFVTPKDYNAAEKLISSVFKDSENREIISTHRKIQLAERLTPEESYNRILKTVQKALKIRIKLDRRPLPIIIADADICKKLLDLKKSEQTLKHFYNNVAETKSVHKDDMRIIKKRKKQLEDSTSKLTNALSILRR